MDMIWRVGLGLFIIWKKYGALNFDNFSSRLKLMALILVCAFITFTA